jgi:uncharacterized protein (TIGR02217 family)
MSNDVFPTLPGLKWGTNKQPIWATKVLTAASGRETRGSFQSYPRWKFTLSYEFLRAGGGFSELQQLVGFFNQRMGSFDSFLYRDPNDYQVADQALGTGDGSRVEYRLVRALGGFVEPVLAPADVWVYIDRGSAGKWRVSGASRTNYFARTDDMTSTYWSKNGVVVTANAATNPDGSATADLLTEDTANTSHRIWRTVYPVAANVRHCISMRVRANGRTALSLSMPWTNAGSANFDLAAETSSVRAGTVEATGIRNLGGGWYRVWLVVRPSDTAGATFAAYMLPAPTGAVTYTGDGISGMYYDALHMETLAEDDPAEPTEYIKNTTAAALTVPADYTLADAGYLTFTVAPAAGQQVSWSGTFYFRCRFTHDALEIEQFMQDLYSGKKVEFISEK